MTYRNERIDNTIYGTLLGINSTIMDTMDNNTITTYSTIMPVGGSSCNNASAQKLWYHTEKGS
jgi:hypothetical protein